jgi:hypothetical protein
MIQLDFGEHPLVNRLVAREDLANALDEIAKDDGDVIVDLGSNVATTSWVDAFLVPLVSKIDRPIVVIATSDVSRSHIATVLRARGLRVTVARTNDDARRGLGEPLPAA